MYISRVSYVFCLFVVCAAFPSYQNQPYSYQKLSSSDPRQSSRYLNQSSSHPKLLSPYKKQPQLNQNQSSPLGDACSLYSDSLAQDPPLINATSQKEMASLLGADSELASPAPSGLSPSSKSKSNKQVQGVNLTSRASGFSDHNDAWRDCWARGKYLWSILTNEQRLLRDTSRTPPFSSPGWWKTCPRGYSRPADEFCVDNALLKRVGPADNPYLDLCSASCFNHIFWFGRHDDPAMDDLGFQVQYATNRNLIISRFLREDTVWDEDQNAYPLDVWPDFVFSDWFGLCLVAKKPASSLKSIFFGNLGSEEASSQILEVIEDIIDHDQSPRPSPGVSPLLTFTPADDNFYALLGTDIGSSALKLLSQHANGFATRNKVGVLEKVKSVESVKLSGWEYSLSGEVSETDLSLKEYTFGMFLTLQDIDPAPDTPRGGQAGGGVFGESPVSEGSEGSESGGGRSWKDWCCCSGC